jgi:hypothetical protein
MEEKEPKSKPMLIDASAKSANPDLPAFLARPQGAPVYHGFPLVEETRTDGWCYGAISDFLAEDRDGCTFGDGFVEAPDGSRAGLIWEVGDGEITESIGPEEGRWGVYAVWFERPVRTIEDLVYNFQRILPGLRAIHARLRGTET